MTAPTPPKVRGFLASVALFRSKVLASWDLWIGVGAGVAMYLLTAEADARGLLDRLTGPGIAVSTALVGVVIAALAVIVAFLDPEFTSLMDRATKERHGGMEGQLFPFWFVTGLGIATILLSLAIIAVTPLVPDWAAHLFIGVLTLMIVWTALGVFNLVSYLHATGVSKAVWIRRKGERDDA